MTEQFTSVWKRAAGVSRTSTAEHEMHRILDLPVIGSLTPEEFEDFNARELLEPAFKRGDRFFPVQADSIVSYDETNGLFAPIGVGHGKCCRAGTEFYDLEAGRRVVEDPGTVRVPSMTSEGRIEARSGSCFPSGVKQCFRLTLASGQDVEISGDHPVFTQRGWIKLEDLDAEQDFVATPRSLPEPKVLAEVSDDEVLFAAYMMSDGSCSVGQPAFTNMEEEVWQELEGVVHRLGGSFGRVDQKSRAVTKNIRGLMPLLKRLGLRGHTAHTKRLPANWYCLPPHQIALFLSRFIACDGHVDPRNGIIEIGLANRGLIRDLRHLALRLGVHGSVRYKLAKYQYGEKDSWYLKFSGEQAVRLARALRYIPAKEVRRVGFFSWRNHNPNVDVVPFGREELQEACEEMGIPGRGGCWRNRKDYTGVSRSELREFLGATAGQNVSRSKFEEFVQRYGYEGKYAWLASSDLKWSKVKSIEPVGSHAVYDLNVPGTESWIGNGVVLHNSLISLAIASRAFRRGVERIMIFNPPQLIPQLFSQQLPFARAKICMYGGFINLYGKDRVQRRAIARRTEPGIYVMPYSLLSSEDAEDLLEGIGPDLLIFDEAHYIKSRKRARTRRVLDYMKRTKPQSVFLSGTMTQKSIVEYHHMISQALGAGSPLPLPAHLVESWACKIDAGAEDVAEAENIPRKGAGLRPLISWANKQGYKVPANLSGVRRAYRFRLNTAPGVVSTPDDDIGVSLIIQNTPVPKFDDPQVNPEWPELDRLMKQVDEKYISPSGDEIDHAMHRWRYLDELTAGFYNLLEWPSPEKVAGRAGISEDEAAERIEGSRVHHGALQDYHKVLRKFLGTHHIRGLDTPMLVGRHLSKEGAKGLPGTFARDLHETWQEAKELEFLGMVERDSRGVRVSPYKIRHAINWAKKLPKNKGALVWYYHREMGRWISEEFQKAGFDTLHCPAGDAANKQLANIEEHKRKIVVLGLGAHSEGKNLQCMEHQFYVQFPRDSKLAQQSIGRTHRSGQKAGELFVNQCLTTEFDSQNFAACLVDAAYQHGSGGNRQKIIYAAYDPSPKIYPPEFLQERGLQVQQLDETEKKLLTEKFSQ